jgi:hypothetical protein
MPHMLLTHAAVPLASAGQALPHAPQFDGSEARADSQPSQKLLSQSSNPISHEPIAHAPATQAVVPWATTGQTWPHAPQFATSVAVLTSQPSVIVALQLAYEVAHPAKLQTASWHATLDPGAAVHMVAQSPQ